MTKWSVKERAMEAMSHKLDQGGMAMSDWFSDKLYKKRCKFYRNRDHDFLHKVQISPVHGV